MSATPVTVIFSWGFSQVVKSRSAVHQKMVRFASLCFSTLTDSAARLKDHVSGEMGMFPAPDIPNLSFLDCLIWNCSALYTLLGFRAGSDQAWLNDPGSFYLWHLHIQHAAPSLPLEDKELCICHPEVLTSCPPHLTGQNTVNIQLTAQAIHLCF